MSIKLAVPQQEATQIKPRISVIGVGGAGGNAVNNMISSKLEGVDFLVANTDAQSLDMSLTDRRIQLGMDTTQGLGAGANPEVGEAAAEEALNDLLSELESCNMLFITAGMGGGTGTGAAPVIARTAREKGILTVGVVTKPFQFEGRHRMDVAEQGIEKLSQSVDTLIIIPNQNLFRVANEKTTFADAFKMADDVLHAGVRSVTDLMIMPGLINLDFADVRAVMCEMGKAMMGTGEAEGERRALDAAETAIANPLLDDTSMTGARGVLINITGGMDLTLYEVDEAANRIRDEVDADANIIFGSCFEENLDGRMRVSVVATGIDNGQSVPRPALKPTETARLAAPQAEEIPAQQEEEIPAQQAEDPAALQVEDTEPTWAQPVHTPPAASETSEAPEEPASPSIPVMPPAREHFAATRTGEATAQTREKTPETSSPPAEDPAFAKAQTREKTPETSSRPAEDTAFAKAQKAAAQAAAGESEEPAPAPSPENTFIPKPPAEADVMPATQTATREETSPPEAEGSTPSLFERVTGLSIVRNSEQEKTSAAPRQQEQKEPEPEDPTREESADNSSLEIPAFLRRHQ